MPLQLKHVLYTAEAVVEGGRDGHGRTSDGRLEVDLSVPAAMSGDDGPGTNPEQLFAVGYAACFQSALLAIARGRNIDPSGSHIASRVGIGPRSPAALDCRSGSTSRDSTSPLRRLASSCCEQISAAHIRTQPAETSPSRSPSTDNRCEHHR